MGLKAWSSRGTSSARGLLGAPFSRPRHPTREGLPRRKLNTRRTKRQDAACTSGQVKRQEAACTTYQTKSGPTFWDRTAFLDQTRPGRRPKAAGQAAMMIRRYSLPRGCSSRALGNLAVFSTPGLMLAAATASVFAG